MSLQGLAFLADFIESTPALKNRLMELLDWKGTEDAFDEILNDFAETAHRANFLNQKHLQDKYTWNSYMSEVARIFRPIYKTIDTEFDNDK
jgi:hypothetical protein